MHHLQPCSSGCSRPAAHWLLTSQRPLSCLLASPAGARLAVSSESPCVPAACVSPEGKGPCSPASSPPKTSPDRLRCQYSLAHMPDICEQPQSSVSRVQHSSQAVCLKGSLGLLAPPRLAGQTLSSRHRTHPQQSTSRAAGHLPGGPGLPAPPLRRWRPDPSQCPQCAWRPGPVVLPQARLACPYQHQHPAASGCACKGGNQNRVYSCRSRVISSIFGVECAAACCAERFRWDLGLCVSLCVPSQYHVVHWSSSQSSCCQLLCPAEDTEARWFKAVTIQAPPDTQAGLQTNVG